MFHFFPFLTLSLILSLSFETKFKICIILINGRFGDCSKYNTLLQYVINHKTNLSIIYGLNKV